MDADIAQQQRIAGQISRTEENLRKAGQSNITLGFVEATLDRLEKKWKQMQKKHDYMEEAATKEDLKLDYFQTDFITQAEDCYVFQKGKLLDWMRAFKQEQQPQKQPVQQSLQRESNQPLPKISLPKFSGEHSDWTTFRDLFSSMIHNNASLSNIERMHYLKMSLIQEPAALIASIPIANDSFHLAWATLKNRYENKRLMTTAQISNLFSLSHVKLESAHELKTLRNGTVNAIGALKILGRPIDSCDDFIVYMTVQKLDKQSRREWEQLIGSKKEPPSFAELQSFLDTRISTVEALECITPHVATTSTKSLSCSTSRQSRSGTATTLPRIKTHQASSITVPQRKCSLCQQDHYILFCDQFRAKSAEERKAAILANNLCLNCLGRHHARECRSQKSCQVCKGKHHTMIHDAPHRSTIAAQSVNVNTTESHTFPSTSLVSSQNAQLERNSSQGSVLLATAIVNVRSSYDELSTTRALLDQGSEASFITEALVQRLRLSRQSAPVIITGIGANSSAMAKGRVSLSVTSHFNQSSTIEITAFILPRLTTYTPPKSLSLSQWSHLKGLLLADPNFSDTRSVELLLGADVYSRLILNGVRQGSDRTPSAQNTRLGWILSGPVRPLSNHCLKQSTHQVSIDHTLPFELQRFWEQEEPTSSAAPPKPDELECEKHFVTTHSRNAEGKYIVRLPFKKSPKTLGDSITAAKHMLDRMERRFRRETQFHTDYSNFINEYEALGHMETVLPTNAKTASTFYLPHHGVIRESSMTTKLRVVFNGSQKTDSGVSLNDLLHVGTNLLPDLVNILFRWRTHAVVFSADMEKMYRQVLLHKEDCDFQRILWREPSSELKTYRLRTVTYGLTCAPFLAIRVLHQLASDERDHFPLGSRALLTDVYVDDILSGADDVSSAITKQQELIGLLKAGGFSLRKWASNSSKLLEHIPTSSINGSSTINCNPNSSAHVLGLTWQSGTDTFLFSVKNPELQSPLTKRGVLSRIAQLFDPLGLLAPVTIQAKIFMQSLWLLKLGWDDPLPETESLQWSKFYKDLSRISELRIPRWMGLRKSSHIEIHGFADASERAYAAVIYMGATRGTTTSVSLVSAKTKVAPVKQISLPRLELCAAVLVSKLARHVREVLNLECPVHLWSDSTVTLAWIRDHPTRWKTYVANRVSEIQRSLPNATWHHVSSQENPADCASRGLHASVFIDHSLWWTGPKWLVSNQQKWPTTTIQALKTPPELRVASHAAAIVTEAAANVFYRYWDLQRLTRIVAWCFRFVSNIRYRLTGSGQVRVTPFLLPCEINDSLLHLIKLEQRRCFHEQINALIKKKTIMKGPLLRLNPYLDQKGQLRLGGRLKHSLLSEDEKNPVILAKESPLTTLIIKMSHLRTLHGGTQLTLATLRQRYWILGGRDAVKSVIRQCIKCLRFRAIASTQIMGNLPTSRVTPGRPFMNAGIDYAGPIHLRTTKGRGHKAYKAYIAVFVCFSTRAVHLEAVSDYSTEAFLAAYKRFTSRRGICLTITSDCGTNFVGADAELRAMFSAASSKLQKIADLLANDGTQWKFNPPAAPHFGGLWEAAVKSVKHHLRRVIGESTLTFEEMTTLLAQIEACLNSRPISAMSDDPDDLSALTPAHFLIGCPLTAVPEPSFTDLPISLLSRWQMIQQMRNSFWNRWSTEYLHQLQARPKWQRQQPPLQVGDLVIIKNELLTPTKWPLARIIALHPGDDGNIRVATIKTATSTMKRPIVKLCLLLKGELPAVKQS